MPNHKSSGDAECSSLKEARPLPFELCLMIMSRTGPPLPLILSVSESMLDRKVKTCFHMLHKQHCMCAFMGSCHSTIAELTSSCLLYSRLRAAAPRSLWCCSDE